MTTASKKPLKLFYCYAHEDKALRDELDIHLSSLKRQKLVTSWYDGEIGPGTEWEKEIDIQLRNADLILLLVTPQFIASDYCYDTEMKRALERHQAGTVRVIPVILRRTYWNDAPFSSLQILPTGAKPVTQWSDRDEAFWDIIVGIHKAIQELRLQECIDEGKTLCNLKRYEEALAAFEQAICLDPNDARAYNGKGAALSWLKRYEEALAVFEQAICLDPNYARAYNNKGNTLRWLKRYEEALAVFEQAIRLDPNYAMAYNGKGIVLYYLKRYEEALAAYEQAIHLDPNYVMAYNLKGIILCCLKRYEESLAACEQAIRLDPNDAKTYYSKGYTLDKLKRSKEAQQYYEEARQLGYNV